ncbi:SUMF1/EgtB/PvdO family nonheme iron enzyme [Accumulibacter sp.]|uniref:SUMF1/EgtB/PvdO family nonheme iron enzyme n=1 Tax=Accumulibacter sp. TaxID=2053492 RepID=UPI002600C3D4|nr:SUMF1/EgtB/PvdO family nonheme iron enzyme [Accumulibacter sp.]MCM8595759.1 formylglycine-generating enzyme family protein [Accumulibacter sp.]MCM8626608.1 formylglycine-generating enzyme family protein [Accumulibacter sp.]MDS4049907.1 SUMF1/EgtB/PvdO family nonheme iron enzyme [Accumulibacter sp.]
MSRLRCASGCSRRSSNAAGTRRPTCARGSLPPVVEIPAGEYPIGSDEGPYHDEAPVDEVKLAPFAIGRFPVTNAERRLFVDAGGYQDERWWQGEAAKRWQRGEATDEGPKEHWRTDRRYLR